MEVRYICELIWGELTIAWRRFIREFGLVRYLRVFSFRGAGEWLGVFGFVGCFFDLCFIFVFVDSLISRVFGSW